MEQHRCWGWESEVGLHVRGGEKGRSGRRRRGSQGTESFGRQIPDNVARTCHCYRASPDNSGNVQPAGALIKIGPKAGRSRPGVRHYGTIRRPAFCRRIPDSCACVNNYFAGDVRSLCAYNHARSVLIHAALHRQLMQGQSRQTTQWVPDYCPTASWWTQQMLIRANLLLLSAWKVSRDSLDRHYCVIRYVDSMKVCFAGFRWFQWCECVIFLPQIGEHIHYTVNNSTDNYNLPTSLTRGLLYTLKSKRRNFYL